MLGFQDGLALGSCIVRTPGHTGKSSRPWHMIDTSSQGKWRKEHKFFQQQLGKMPPSLRLPLVLSISYVNLISMDC